jgi:hypothetical protein
MLESATEGAEVAKNGLLSSVPPGTFRPRNDSRDRSASDVTGP